MKLLLTYSFCFMFFYSFGQKNILGNDTTLCEGDLLIINLIDLNAQTYLWQDGTNNPFYVVQKEGQYSVTVTVQNKVFEASKQVKYLKYPTFELGNDTSACRLLPVTLNLKNPNAIYQWSDGTRFQQRTIVEEGTYWARVSNGTCSFSDTIKITEKDCPDFQFYAPNAFSPNGDETNDTWQIYVHKEYPVKDFLLQIFDQWGNQLFENQDITTTWDGTYKSETLASGNYVYRLSMTYFNPFTKKEKTFNTGGVVFLMR